MTKASGQRSRGLSRRQRPTTRTGCPPDETERRFGEERGCHTLHILFGRGTRISKIGSSRSCQTSRRISKSWNHSYYRFVHTFICVASLLIFSPDYEYYLSQQILPPVDRLCDPIEGTDKARLAECLGQYLFLSLTHHRHSLVRIGSHVLSKNNIE